jgi:hypothetical protein
MANTKVTGDLIASSTIATGNIADNAVTSDKISGITTAHIAEGSNLYYTDARADARVALIVDSAPATLDTLNELAAALGDDPNFATTTANSIGLKAPLASPSFTGNATFAGNVLIGTNINSSIGLQVNQSLGSGNAIGFFRNSASSGGNGLVVDVTNTPNNYLADFRIGNSSKVRIDSSGNSTFAGNLAINGTSGDTVVISKSTTEPSIRIKGDTGKDFVVTISGELLTVTQNDGGTDILTLDHDTKNATFAGNVGIGTNSPTNLLTINDPNANGSITDTIPSWWGLIIDRAYTTSSTAAIGLIGGTVATGSSGRLYLGNSDDVDNTYIDGGANQMHFAVGGSEKIRIESNGNLLLKGTGTTSLLKFDSSAYGQILSTSNILYYDIDTQVFRNSAGTERMRITSGGNVGIGNTGPQYKLDVLGTSNQQDVLKLQTAWSVVGDYVGMGIGDGWIRNYVENASKDYRAFAFAPRGTERMRIEAGGNVGIGTTSPTRTLDVNGEITHEGLVPKAGAFVDGLVTINKTVSTSANTWTSLDISLGDIGGTGTFVVQVYSDAHGTTYGAWYTVYWSGIMSWYHTTTNDDDIDEIPLHMAGHARNNNTLELRTKLHINDGTSYANRCELQIKTANALSSAPISFRFRKLL